MQKQYVGQHLLRVRISHHLVDQLRELAEEESDKLNAHVTISDIVRTACVYYLAAQESLRRLECIPPENLDGEHVWVVTTLPIKR